MADSYEVGYGKPPKEGQFAKGKSGNPKGRPQGSKSISTMFNEITRELINVKENGKTKTMTRIEAVIHQMTNMSLTGNPRTIKEFLYLSRIFEEAEQAQNESSVPHERETAVFQSVLKRMQKMSQATEDLSANKVKKSKEKK